MPRYLVPRCAHCGNIIRVMAFLDDEFCSLDCQRDHEADDDECGA